MTTPTCRAALAELVAVKDIKERAAALHFAGPSGPLGEGWEAEWRRLEREYIERQPKAWAAARTALSQEGLTNEKYAITLKNAHALADMVHRTNDGPVEALHIAIDMLASAAQPQGPKDQI